MGPYDPTSPLPGEMSVPYNWRLNGTIREFTFIGWSGTTELRVSPWVVPPTARVPLNAAFRVLPLQKLKCDLGDKFPWFQPSGMGLFGHGIHMFRHAVFTTFYVSLRRLNDSVL
jgi:hypothetical protein